MTMTTAAAMSLAWFILCRVRNYAMLPSYVVNGYLQVLEGQVSGIP